MSINTTTSNFHNASFADDLAKGKYNGVLYIYRVEFDSFHSVWNLSICSTSLSELDEDEEGELGSYTYLEENEAREDVYQAMLQYKIEFDIDMD